MQIKIQINEKQGVNPFTQHEAVKNQHARHNITFEWLRLSSHKSQKSHLTGVYSAFAINAALNIVTCPRARVHFTIACLVAKPLNRSEAKDDLVMIQTSLLFKKTVFITTWSPLSSPQMKGLATKYTTVTWLIVMNILVIITWKQSDNFAQNPGSRWLIWPQQILLSDWFLNPWSVYTFKQIIKRL